MTFIIIVFLFLGLLPIVEAFHFIKKHLSQPIKIPEDRTKDPRFFGNSFRSKFDTAFTVGDKTITLNKEEKILYVKDLDKTNIDVNNIVVCKKDVLLNVDSAIFNKEFRVYGKCALRGKVSLRALAVDGECFLGIGTHVSRWVDVNQDLVVNTHSDLGLSASSGKSITLAKDVRFHRLYAPFIRLGFDLDLEEASYEHPATNQALKQMIHLTLTKDLGVLNEKKTFINHSILSRKHLHIPKDVWINGSIKTHKDLILHEGALVNGDIIAEGNVYIEPNVCVLGNIFAHGDIEIKDNVTMGALGHLVSVVSTKSILVGRRVTVYGYIHSEKQGACFIERHSAEMVKEQMIHELKTWPNQFHVNPKLAKAMAYSELKHKHPSTLNILGCMPKIEIPEGVTKIRNSFFYNCTHITEVTLPSSIKVIEKYAFYGCTNLKKINLVDCYQLVHIDDYAFMNCTSLKKVDLPSTLKGLGVAVFMNDVNLKSVHINPNAPLSLIASHSFMNCGHLSKINLTEHVKEIQMSAFRNCKSLKTLRLPDNVKKIDPFAFVNTEHLKLRYTKTKQEKLLNQLIFKESVTESH